MRATDALRTALQELLTEKGLSWPAKAAIAPPKDARHGDLAANIAMLLAKDAGRNPRELAQEVADALARNGLKVTRKREKNGWAALEAVLA